ncbi:MAG: DNA-binding response regulator [Flavobacteriales bacterium]|jgi:DNA-binding LytR/AlgR family response regulator|nr:DNA-binding response regulator [Flavobacteriales bacterium]
MDTQISLAIIEDDFFLATGLKKILSNNGYNVHQTFPSGEQFFSQGDFEQIDLVIIDIMLKGTLTGIDIGKRLKDDYPNIPFIFLTGLCDNQTIKEVLALDPICYIKKPYDDTTLLVNINIATTKINEATEIEYSKVKINDGKKYYHLSIKDILFLQSDGNYVNFFLTNGKEIMVRGKLNDYCESHDFKSFIRTHVRFLINPDHIFHYNYRYFEIENHQIPISEKYRPEMRLRFK